MDLYKKKYKSLKDASGFLWEVFIKDIYSLPRGIKLDDFSEGGMSSLT